MTDGRLSAKMSDIEHGIRSARGVAELDIGQGVVVRKGTVIAVEAYEGTDPMLKRAGEFKWMASSLSKPSKPAKTTALTSQYLAYAPCKRCRLLAFKPLLPSWRGINDRQSCRAARS